MTKYPTCKDITCENNNPEFINHCKLFSKITACIHADIDYLENYLSPIAWLRKYGLNVGLILAVLAVIIILGYVNWKQW